MYYVLEVELREIGVIKVLNDGKPFEDLVDCYSYINNIVLINSGDMLDFLKFEIIKKDNDSFLSILI